MKITRERDTFKTNVIGDVVSVKSLLSSSVDITSHLNDFLGFT